MRNPSWVHVLAFSLVAPLAGIAAPAQPRQAPPREEPAARADHHAQGAPHDEHAGEHGNPADLAEYIRHQEDPARDEWQKPDAVVAALALKPGQVACDIGPGPGYFTLRMAKQVGAAGRVFAVDVEPRMLDVLRARVTQAHLANVTPVLAAFDNPFLPQGACDVVLEVNTYHHFENGPAYLLELKRVLRPGGVLVNVDFHKRETPMGPPVERRVSREAFLKDAETAGFMLRREETFLPHQYMVVMAPR
jgi:predicted methyltransferase